MFMFREGRMIKLVGSEARGHACSRLREISHQPAIPVIDVRRGGPVTHARLQRQRMMALRNA
jgi:hypothetical protein